MGTRGTEVDVGKILRLTHAVSPDCSSLEMNYKCLVRWYRTPDKLHQFQKETFAGGDVQKLELCSTFGGHAQK